MSEPALCVLLSDHGPASEEALKLLLQAKVPFTVVDSSDPRRADAPQLYTPEGIVRHLGFIREWIKQRQHNGESAPSLSPSG